MYKIQHLEVSGAVRSFF